MKRAGMVALLLSAVIAVATPARAAAPAVPEVFEARAEAGGAHDSIAVPAYFETFAPYSLSEASNGSAHSYQAVFYAGFFLTAAAGQFGFPPPPGTAETLYPQGPADQTAEAIPISPGAFGQSEAHAGATGARGTATMGGGGANGFALGAGKTTSEVAATATSVTSTATVLMQDVDLAGAARIGSISGTATAIATGVAGGARVDGSLVLSNVTVGGAPVAIPTFDVPVIPGVDTVFSAAGITVRRLPDTRSVAADGTAAALELGGVQIVLSRPEREFTLELTFGRLSVSARAVPVGAPLPAPAATFIPGSPGGVDILGEVTGVPSLDAAGALTGGEDGLAAVRVRSVRPVRGLDASATAALLALIALALPFARRVLNPTAPRRSP